MADISAKIRIKMGIMEVEYEGESSFLEDGLSQLLSELVELSQNMPTQVSIEDVDSEIVINSENNVPKSSHSRTIGVDFTTSMVASHSDAADAVDLALCAMAYLELKNGTKPNDRKAILSEMKTVSSIYNATMNKNHAANLKRLAKNRRINDMGSNKFSLGKEELARFEGIIAQFE